VDDRQQQLHGPEYRRGFSRLRDIFGLDRAFD
jgi:hypothetical protein